MTDEPVAVGKVTKAHGIRGEVTVLVLTEFPEERFSPGSVVHLEGGRTLTVEASRNHQSRMLVKFAEAKDRSGADDLRGKLLFVPESSLPELPEGSYWPHQLEGCEVFTEEGRSLGRITEVITTGANDVWVAKDGEAEVLVPAIADVVSDVDIGSRRVTVREVPGLLGEE